MGHTMKPEKLKETGMREGTDRCVYVYPDEGFPD